MRSIGLELVFARQSRGDEVEFIEVVGLQSWQIINNSVGESEPMESGLLKSWIRSRSILKAEVSFEVENEKY